MICDGCTHAECCPAKEEHGGAKRCSAFKPQEMTNEEWLRTATTEQLAEILLAIYQDGIDDCKQEWWKDTKEDFVEWLKQQHNNEVEK